jgi:hypothetical protein
MIIRKTTRNLLRYLGVKRNGVVNGTQGHVPGITYQDHGNLAAAGNDPGVRKVEPK